MADVFFDNPPLTKGTAEQQVEAVVNYLHTMSQKLNESMNNISVQQLTEEGQQAVKQTKKNEQLAEDNRQKLKALIIKNANIVKNAMEEIRAELHQDIEAVSEQFGTYQESISAELLATAQGIQQSYEALETIVNTANGVNEEYRTRMQSFIYSGILSNNPYTTGIAIGQNVTNADGTLNDQNKMATFTADRITFYMNGNEIGWYEGNSFHISNGEVTDSMKMGNFVWKVFSDGSMGLIKV